MSGIKKVKYVGPDTDIIAVNLRNASGNEVGAGLPTALGQASAAWSMPVIPAGVLIGDLSANALNADLLPSTDVSSYKSISLQVLGTWSGTLTVQGSNDGTNWSSVMLHNQGVSQTPPSATYTANGLYVGPLHYKYLRVRLTSYVSGPVTGAAMLSAVSSQFDGITGNVTTTQLTSPWVVANRPETSGGLSSYRNLDLGLTGQVVKNGAGQLYTLQVTNLAAAARYVKVYNKATAPTEADTPVYTFAVPAATVAQPVNMPAGVAFAAGIALRASNAIADADTTAPTANDVVVNIGYK